MISHEISLCHLAVSGLAGQVPPADWERIRGLAKELAAMVPAAKALEAGKQAELAGDLETAVAHVREALGDVGGTAWQRLRSVHGSLREILPSARALEAGVLSGADYATIKRAAYEAGA